LRIQKDTLTHDNYILKDKEKDLFDLTSNLVEETNQHKAESDFHTNLVDYKQEISKICAQNQDALIKDLQNQLEKLNKNIELTRKNKQQLEDDIKDRKQKETELREVHENSVKILNDLTKVPFDELKLKQVQRENKTLKFRIEQAIKEGDEYATQLIAIKDKRNGIVEDYKVFNEQLKEETEQLNEELRKSLLDEKHLKEQNIRITKQLNEKKRIFSEKEAIIDSKTLEDEEEENPRVMISNKISA